MKKISSHEAKKLYKLKLWEKMTDEEIVRFQLFQDYLIMPFPIYSRALSRILNRPVYSHEFAAPEFLQKEFLKEIPSPSIDEIFARLVYLRNY